jgi:uncharacterized protein (TIGR03084 family)
MAADIKGLLVDLDAETAVLDAVLDTLSDADWSRPSPAPGFSVFDQVSHLGYFDEAVTTALLDPDAYRSERDALLGTNGAEFTEAIAARYRDRSAAEIREWFGRARATMRAAFAGIDPTVRVPWYGPDMAVASALTARIMETWAHGQDIDDAVGAGHPQTGALRHIVHLGVRTREYSFVNRGLDAPAAQPRVELRLADGSMLEYGPADAGEWVRGAAVEFALVVTRRRHLADTALEIVGEGAAEWMAIAQAFAGPPGAGREPGQFARD